MSEKKGPRSRADSALSNLVLEGGKSRTYQAGPSANGKFVGQSPGRTAETSGHQPNSTPPRKTASKHY